jgi:hypothetical protein
MMSELKGNQGRQRSSQEVSTVRDVAEGCTYLLDSSSLESRPESEQSLRVHVHLEGYDF